MIPLGVVPLIALLSMPVAEFDIPWYVDHPQERHARILECQNDFRIAQSLTCLNAHAAEQRALAIEGMRQDRPKFEESIRKFQFPGAPTSLPARKGNNA